MIRPEFWNRKKVFITGHTGFKGSWLCHWLTHLGAEVYGYSLPAPSNPSLYEISGIGKLITSTEGDVRDGSQVLDALVQSDAEIVVHMAAQSLVRRSYKEPIETFTTNAIGTANVLNAIRQTPSVKAVVIVTSDKCYQNIEWVWGYRENDRLGGRDPYSASKACAEIVVSAFRNSFFEERKNDSVPAIASCRAGNVIGGGDWADDRLIPDILRSLLKNEPTLIRSPQATRPWQHVLEPLHGYLTLAERLFEVGHNYAEAWNFGPDEQSERTVGWIIDKIYELWSVDFDWVRDRNPGPAECTFLKLDSSKSKGRLGWRPKLDLPTALEWIVQWTRQYKDGADMREITLREIETYMALERKA